MVQEKLKRNIKTYLSSYFLVQWSQLGRIQKKKKQKKKQ